MRKLIEDEVYESLIFEFTEDSENVEGMLDLDLGVWNSDDGPLNAEVISKIVNDCNDQELLEVYRYLVSGGR